MSYLKALMLSKYSKREVVTIPTPIIEFDNKIKNNKLELILLNNSDIKLDMKIGKILIIVNEVLTNDRIIYIPSATNIINNLNLENGNYFNFIINNNQSGNYSIILDLGNNVNLHHTSSPIINKNSKAKYIGFVEQNNIVLYQKY